MLTLICLYFLTMLALVIWVVDGLLSTMLSPLFLLFSIVFIVFMNHDNKKDGEKRDNKKNL